MLQMLKQSSACTPAELALKHLGSIEIRGRLYYKDILCEFSVCIISITFFPIKFENLEMTQR